MATLQIRYDKLINSQKCMAKLFKKTFSILKGFVESSQKFAENFADLQVKIDEFVQSNEENFYEEMDEIDEETEETTPEQIELVKSLADKSKQTRRSNRLLKVQVKNQKRDQWEKLKKKEMRNQNLKLIRQDPILVINVASAIRCLARNVI